MCKIEPTKFENTLTLDRCPHCNISNPGLPKLHSLETKSSEGKGHRDWNFYACTKCGGIITASAFRTDAKGEYRVVRDLFPSKEYISNDIPAKAKAFLKQSIESLHAPSGAIMLTASSIDAMLKEKGLKEGKLYHRIDQAAKEHIITEDMAKWAHQIRLDANDQRHADDEAELPDEDDAKKCIDFAKAIGQFLFVLPSMVTRGIENSSPDTASSK